jgi:hypothetical protein
VPQRLLRPSLDRPARWGPKASPDATEPQVRKARPDRRGLKARRVSPVSQDLRENPDEMVLRGPPAQSARRVLQALPALLDLLDLLDLLAAPRHEPQRRDNPVLLARWVLKDRPDLPGPRARRVWQGIKALRGLKAPRDPEESQARPGPRVLLDLRGLWDPWA